MQRQRLLLIVRTIGAMTDMGRTTGHIRTRMSRRRTRTIHSFERSILGVSVC